LGYPDRPGACWRTKWSLVESLPAPEGLWKIVYWESDNSPIITDFPDIDIAYEDLEQSLVEAQEFSVSSKWGWEKWFRDAIQLLHNPLPVQPFYADLIPNTFENTKVRRLLAGALKAWVFGGLGSWNDMYITDVSQGAEYQRISRNLYQSVIQALGAITNLTASDSSEAFNHLSD